MKNTLLKTDLLHDNETASGRLNSWLDKFDWPPLENGRAQAIATALDCSKSMGRKYLSLNVLPRTQEEKRNAAQILSGISLSWWEYGIEDTPKTAMAFSDSNSNGIEQLEYVVAIERLSSSHNISLSIEKIDSIKKVALHFSRISGVREPDTELLEELIKISK